MLALFGAQPGMPFGADGILALLKVDSTGRRVAPICGGAGLPGGSGLRLLGDVESAVPIARGEWVSGLEMRQTAHGLHLWLDVNKAWPFLGVQGPASPHDVEEFIRAFHGSFQGAAVGQQIEHLRVLPVGIGLLAECHNFPEEYTEGPDVAFGGEKTVIDHLGGEPAQRQHILAVHSIVVNGHRSGESKVRQFRDPLGRGARGDEAISGRNVAMYMFVRLQVEAAPARVHRHGNQVAHANP